MTVTQADQTQSQYLTFILQEETFAVGVEQVTEILDAPAITRVPRTPDFVAGVINLRGRVVPVIDLRLRFGLAAHDGGPRCIVVLEVVEEGVLCQVGALVDGVQEVVPLQRDQIEPPPRLGLGLHLDFLVGVGKLGESFVLLLNVPRLFSGGEVEVMRQLQAGAAVPTGAAA